MNPAVTSAHFSTESAARAAHEHRFPLDETVTFSGDHDDQKQQEENGEQGGAAHGPASLAQGQQTASPSGALDDPLDPLAQFHGGDGRCRLCVA